MIALALPFAKKYWLQIATAVVMGGMALTIYVQHVQKQNITLSFENFKLASLDLVRKRETEIAVKAGQSEAAKKEREATYAQEISRLQDRVKQYQAKYDGVAADNVRLADVNSGLRNAADSSRRAMSEMVKAASSLAGSGKDCDERAENEKRAREALEIACTQTTIDYDELRYWVDDQGMIFGWAD